MFDTLRSVWLRAGRWPRLLAAGTCLLLAALSALGTARERVAARAAPRMVAVVVSTHAVGAGHVLHAGDLRVERWPAAVHPPRTPATVRTLVGRRTAGALVAREPVTAARVLGSGVATGLPTGLGALPVEITGGRAADYVRAGDHVDVLAGPPPDVGADSDDAAGSELVAGDATVLSVLPGSTGEATVVVVAADRATALRVTRQESSESFTLVVISP